MSMYDLKEEVAVLAKSDGIFGKGQLLRVNSATDDEKGAQFASELNFVQVEMKTDVGVEETPIVVKKQVCEMARLSMDTDTQFANEVVMYSVIMPKLGVSALNIIPRFIFGRATAGKSPDDDILILEDLRPHGFKVPDDLFLNADHILPAMRKLGQFHALSYKLKKTSPNELDTLGKLLKNPNRKIDEVDIIQFEHALIRGFKPLMDEAADDSIICRTFAKMTERVSVLEWNHLKEPEEPFTAIIHGDFNRNNLFYQYDSQGKVTDLKFLDFGTSILSDPSIDIAFFLYMNTKPETREQHWDEFFEAYWEGIVSIEPKPGFSFEEFLNHFAKRAISGYFPCSFFLPLMLSGDFGKVGDFLEKTPEERVEWAYTTGGEEGTEAIVNIVRHLHDRGFMEAYLQDTRKK